LSSRVTTSPSTHAIADPLCGLQQSKRHRMSGLSQMPVVLTEALKGRA
jgi:hypothetical protein